MRVTVKSIIKWGLLAEVLTAIVGQVGEFTLRYRAYSTAFDELFGRYRLPGHENEASPSLNRSSPLTSTTLNKANNSLPQEFTLDARPTARRKSASSSSSSGGRVALSRTLTTTTTETPFALNSSSSSSSSSIMGTIFQSAFRSDDMKSSVVVLYPEPKSTESSTPNPSSTLLFSFDSYAKSLQEILTVPSHSVPTDPRPFLVCLALVFAHLLFTIGIAYEYLPLITPLTFFWMLYLILVLLILHAGSSGKRGGGGSLVPTASSTLPSGSGGGLAYISPWSTLTPSPFTVLVLAIILVFALVLIAIIVEERRQLAVRIRSKSAAIPLVKSRDMDLEDDDI